MKKNIGVLLSGCGVYDGSEIHEAVFTLLAIEMNGGNSICIAPDSLQHHVINHISGEEMNESRNVMVEAARIARGNINNLSTVQVEDLDALVIPGGFGAAKNLTNWAIQGAEGFIYPDVKRLIVDMHAAGKPLVGLCMGPTVIAKAFENSGVSIQLTVGTIKEQSPYDISALSAGMEQLGALVEMCSVREIAVDIPHRVITAPCYMMDATIADVKRNADQAISRLFEFL